MMWTMGEDFTYQYAESWFKQMDKLIHYVNKVELYQKDHPIYYIFKASSLSLILSFPLSLLRYTHTHIINITETWLSLVNLLIFQDGRVNALYSTPSLYTDAKNAANQSWPLKTDDYFP